MINPTKIVINIITKILQNIKLLNQYLSKFYYFKNKSNLSLSTVVILIIAIVTLITAILIINSLRHNSMNIVSKIFFF